MECFTVSKLKEKMRFELRKGSKEGFLRGTKYFHAATDKIVSDRLKEEPDLRFDCHAGCSECCDVRVEVITPESIFITEHIVSYFDSSQLEKLTSRMQKHVELSKGKLLEDHESLCPFLSEDNKCSIYEVRPHKCRKMYSMSVEYCRNNRNAAEESILYQNQNELGSIYLNLLIESGVNPMPAELCESVLRLLSTPSLVSRWLKGAQIFDTLPEYQRA